MTTQSHVIRLRLLDSSVEIHAAPELGAQVARLWESFVVAEAGDDAIRYDVSDVVRRAGDVAFAGTVAPPSPLTVLAADLNALALAQCRELAVHAGVVGFGRSVVAIPARSGAGKSTLVAACVGLGARYLSDEALLLSLADPVRVIPYPRPLALSRWSAERTGLLGEGVAAEDEILVRVRLSVSPTDVHPAPTHLVLLDRREGGPSSVTALAREEAVATLLRLSFNAWRHPETAFRVVTGVVRQAQTLRLCYSDALDAARTLAEHVDGLTPPGAV